MRVNVQGGTRAGCKRPLRAPAKPWRCECPREIYYGLSTGHVPESRLEPAEYELDAMLKTNPGYLVRCPTCRTARP